LLNISETIKDLEISEGRRLLREFFHDRRVKHTFEFRTILDCWRLCKRGTELQFSNGMRVRFETNLGFKLGTRVFFEEIISRFYFNYILGLVYFGAMIVLICVALYLVGFSLWIAIAGFSLESLLLCFYAIVTTYSTPEEGSSGTTSGLPEDLLTSINNTAREMTNAVSDLFRLVSQSDIRQDVFMTRLTEYIAKTNAENFRVYAEKLEETNTILREFVESHHRSLEALETMYREAIEDPRRIGVKQRVDETVNALSSDQADGLVENIHSNDQS